MANEPRDKNPLILDDLYAAFEAADSIVLKKYIAKLSDAPFTITGIPRPSSPESDTRSAFEFRNRRLGCWITHLAFLFSRRNSVRRKLCTAHCTF